MLLTEKYAVLDQHAVLLPVHIKTPLRNELVRKLTVASSPLPRPDAISFETQRFQEAPLSSILRGCVLGISHRLWVCRLIYWLTHI